MSFRHHMCNNCFINFLISKPYYLFCIKKTVEGKNKNEPFAENPRGFYAN